LLPRAVIALYVIAFAPIPLVFELGVEYSGGQAPVGPAPWLNATFTDIGAGTIQLKMEAVRLTGREFLTGWYFNLNPALDPASLSFTLLSGLAASSIQTGIDQFKAGGDGWYDIRFRFPSSGRGDKFGVGDSVVYDVTCPGSAGFSALSFDFLSAPGGGHGPFSTAAHVQGIGPRGEGSGWVTVAMPEYGSLPLLAIGLGALGGLWKRQRSHAPKDPLPMWRRLS
jgi:hypothetical protein